MEKNTICLTKKNLFKNLYYKRLCASSNHDVMENDIVELSNKNVLYNQFNINSLNKESTENNVQQEISFSPSSSAATFESLSTNQSPNRNFSNKRIINSKCINHYQSFYNNGYLLSGNYESFKNYKKTKHKFNEFQHYFSNCKHIKSDLNLRKSLSDDQNFTVSNYLKKAFIQNNIKCKTYSCRKRKVSNDILHIKKLSSAQNLFILHLKALNYEVNNTNIKRCNYCKISKVESTNLSKNNLSYNTEHLSQNLFENSNDGGGNILNCRVISLPNLSDSGIVYDLNIHGNNVINANNMTNHSSFTTGNSQSDK